MASRKTKIIGAIAVVLLILQFLPFDKSNPPVDPKQDFFTVVQAPAPIGKMIKDACYDCHSHHAVYPWYANIQPVGWWVRGHVRNGMKHLNFSVWTTYSEKKANHKLEECVEMLEAGNMPLKSYVWMHPEAQFSDAQKLEMLNWFKSL